MMQIIIVPRNIVYAYLADAKMPGRGPFIKRKLKDQFLRFKCLFGFSDINAIVAAGKVGPASEPH